MAKLHSVTIEAPITRAISIITAAQENSPVYVSQALERVLEILRSKELYSPQFVSNVESIKPMPADPVATDLLGALLSVSAVASLLAELDSLCYPIKTWRKYGRYMVSSIFFPDC